MRRHMITVGLKRLKVVLIGSVLVLLLVLGYVTVTGVVNPSQLTQWQGKHIQRKGLLVLADQNAAAQRRLHNQLPTPQYLRRVQMYQDIQKYLENARYNRTVWKELDLRHFFKPTYKPVQEFKNPCWWEEQVPENTCYLAEKSLKKSLRWMESGGGKTLRCLPYFFIIGQAKCGTTTLFSRIVQHPDVAPHAMKETHWICHGRLSDATPTHFSTHGFWDMLPGNEGCAEPCVTDADVIHHLNPRAKLLLILRNPTTR
ncbi:carbohydrate sulfotransferase 15-like [Haliotis rubra]|uniref:carbohydrate sulfotransferase 15-like n=1 Tax=Haliotis rubra TaxID=36100 RepID=UPI001EE62C0F|nr:carbohydrate sulfotransferase 15-like [Haliotis rubra]